MSPSVGIGVNRASPDSGYCGSAIDVRLNAALLVGEKYAAYSAELGLTAGAVGKYETVCVVLN